MQAKPPHPPQGLHATTPLPTPTASQVAIASGANHTVISPRWTSARSYAGQFPTWYCVLYFGCTLDCMSRSFTCRPYDGQEVDRGAPRARDPCTNAMFRGRPLTCPDDGQPRAVEHEMEALAGRDRSQTARQMLTAPGARRIVGGGEVEAHHPEQGVQESFGLAQRKMGEESQGQGGFDGKIRVPPLPTPPAAPAGRPGSNRFRGHPHRHIAAANEGPIVGRPIRHAVLRLLRGVNLRLHPCSVAPAEARRAGQTAPPTEGLSCNNAGKGKVAGSAGHQGRLPAAHGRPEILRSARCRGA